MTFTPNHARTKPIAQKKDFSFRFAVFAFDSGLRGYVRTWRRMQNNLVTSKMHQISWPRSPSKLGESEYDSESRVASGGEGRNQSCCKNMSH